MLAKLRPHLTYANVMVSILAVLVIGGGGAYAATKLKNNSVSTPKIRNAAVTSPKIAAGAVTSSNIAAGAVTNPAIASGAVTSDKLGGPINATTLGGIGPVGYGTAVIGRMNGLATGASQTDYGAPSGTSTASGTESSVNSILPVDVINPTTLVLSDLIVILTQVPGTGGSRSFSLYVDGASTLLCTSMTGGGNICTSPGFKATVPSGLHTFSIGETTGASGANAADARFTFRVTPVP